MTWSRTQRNTTAAGLGYKHQQKRERLLPAAMNTPCPGPATGPRSPKCVGVMTHRSHMHLDHTVPRALGGTVGDRIICGPCNVSSGGRLGAAIRWKTPPRRRSRDW